MVKTIFSTMIAVSVFAAGCGGGGTSNVAPTGSPFAGNYSGTYSSPLVSGTGTMTASVTGGGAITGTASDATDGQGSMTATITNSGQISGSFSFKNTGTIPFSGTGALNGKTLSGTLTETFQGNNYTVTYSATQQ